MNITELPNYDKESYNKQIKELSDQYSQKRSKFNFRSKPKPVKNKVPQVPEDEQVKIEELVVLTENKQIQIDSQQKTLKNMKNCIINTIAQETMLVNNLHSCIINTSIKSSIMIQNCSNCVFYYECLQARIHECVGLKIFSKCNNTSIIEDCNEIEFGPLMVNGSLPLVDDFNWLKQDPSPHFRFVTFQQFTDCSEIKS